jgi:hypothetical protein
MNRFSLLLLMAATIAWGLLPALPSDATEPDPEPLPEAYPVYQIEMHAEYEPDQGLISGTQNLRWQNTTGTEVNELRFHLYLNAFANNRSTFFQESGGELRGLRMEEGKWGWVEISSIVARSGEGAIVVAAGGEEAGAASIDTDLSTELVATDDGIELIDTETFLAPDDGNPEDRTLVSYQLPQPLAPGETVELAIAFTSQLPGVFARSGKHGDYALAGQWFPKIAVFEDVGVGGRTGVAGWDSHQYHAHSEFYADFGEYDVTLTLPERYQDKIGATGKLIDQWREGDKVTARFTQDQVHDFVWTGDPRYVVVRDRFDPATDVPREQVERIAATLGLPPSELELTPVDITLLIQPANLSQADRYIESVKIALRGYGLRLGAYPYATLTLVDPPRGAFGSGGMEYPTFITLGTHPILAIPPFRKIRMPEMVTIHELGHNYFQGMIASNEFEEPWIDEGINSYYDMLVSEEAYDKVMISFLGMVISPQEQNRTAVAGGGYSDSLVQSSWSFISSGSYGNTCYPRSALTLRQLENLLGPEVYHRAMRHFFQTWRWRHPTTEDFRRAIENASGQDLSWYFDQVLETSWHLDYAVLRARSKKVKAQEGVFWEARERVLVEKDKKLAQAGEDVSYLSTVTVKRNGEVHLPTEVEMVFADGHTIRHSWDGQERWHTWEIIHPAKLTSVEIDPEDKLILDTDRLNNSRRLKPSLKAPSKLLVNILFWLQNISEAASLLG